MQIGEVIRKYRKIKNLTQEEMANRLGVTAPAVNKWENGNSFPDIMLLAPIARLLDISLDTLLSFREELTEEEISNIIMEVNAMMKKESYEDAFRWAKQKIEMYPDCEQLICQLALILDVQRMLKGIPDSEKYDIYILDWFNRVLESKEEQVRKQAADSLFSFYMRKEQYEKAEEYLQYLSIQNPERKRRQAMIYAKTGRIQEAYKIYEEILYADYTVVSQVIYGMYELAMQEQDLEKAHMLLRKLVELARFFEMGKYQELVWSLELAAAEKDVETTQKLMQETISSIEEMEGAAKSPLYEHMTFKGLSKEFREEMKENLKKSFQEGEGLF